MLRKSESLSKKKGKEISIVLLNLALDTRPLSGKAEGKAYLFLSKMGKLRNAKLFHLVELIERMEQATKEEIAEGLSRVMTYEEYTKYSSMTLEQRIEFNKKKIRRRSQNITGAGQR
jgi:hypothetical protein